MVIGYFRVQVETLLDMIICDGSGLEKFGFGNREGMGISGGSDMLDIEKVGFGRVISGFGYAWTNH